MSKKRKKKPAEHLFGASTFVVYMSNADGSNSPQEFSFEDAFGEFAEFARPLMIGAKVIASLLEVDDRSLVIVGMAYLDELLARVLRKGMVNVKAVDQLLDIRGALGTYRSRVDACECFGLIRSETASALVTMGKIRNEFAHRFDVHDLSELEESTDSLGEFRSATIFADDSTVPVERQRFASACRAMALELIRALHQASPRTPPIDVPIAVPVFEPLESRPPA